MPTKEHGRLEWFIKARFGMFIHWGLYSVSAGVWKGNTSEGEWMHMNSNIPGKTYERFAGRFNPVQFDANEWVSVAREAGMKYLVFTTKHHEGFCMFDTKFTDYNIVDATPVRPRSGQGPGRPPAGNRASCLCLYYSVKDWHHPEYPSKRPGARNSTRTAFMRFRIRRPTT